MNQFENTSRPLAQKVEKREQAKLSHAGRIMLNEPPALAGQRFGKWTVLGSRQKVSKAWAWQCRCDCGKVKMVNEWNLRTGKTDSCGCVWSENYKRMFTSHGKTRTPTHSVWKGMRMRCNNPKSTVWNHYGGRGIKVCERWNSFENFLLDMGEKPSGMTLERKDVNGNYEPSNCVWATQKAQMNNTRANVFVEVDGVRKTVAQLAAELGLKYGTLYYRLKRGWSVGRSISMPIRVWK